MPSLARTSHEIASSLERMKSQLPSENRAFVDRLIKGLTENPSLPVKGKEETLLLFGLGFGFLVPEVKDLLTRRLQELGPDFLQKLSKSWQAPVQQPRQEVSPGHTPKSLGQ